MTSERNAQGVDGLDEVMGLIRAIDPAAHAGGEAYARALSRAESAAVNYLRSHGEAIRELVEADMEYDTALAAYRFAQKNAPAFNKIAPRRRRLARALARRRAALAKFSTESRKE